MKPAKVKTALLDSIQSISNCKWMFSVRPGRDNIRDRKLSFEKTISAVLSFRGGTVNHELLDFFKMDTNLPTSSAFVQRRSKIVPEAFEILFHSFTNKASEHKTYRGLRLLAVDGSDLQIASNPNDPESYYPGVNGQKAYNLLHINAMYDLCQRIYTDALIQKSRNSDECGALTAMVDRSEIKKALVLADRGYESYNNLAHIQEKGWYFLIRIKNGTGGIISGLNVPDTKTFDAAFQLHLTRSQSNEVKKLKKMKNTYKFLKQDTRFDFLPERSSKYNQTFFNLNFRIVRFPISDDTEETIITNLDANQFPIDEIKRLYAMRWGIETSFRNLKYTLALLHLHAKKVEFVLQEIFAKLTMYNFCELIVNSVVVTQRKKKYAYKVNFSDAVHICLQFFRGDVPPPDVEALLKRFISPIRPGRKDSRKLIQKTSVSFIYRVA